MLCASVEEDNLRALVSGLSPLQVHKLYNNVLIAAACICTNMFALGNVFQSFYKNLFFSKKLELFYFGWFFTALRFVNVLKAYTR